MITSYNCWRRKGSLHQHLLYGNQRPHRHPVRRGLHTSIYLALNGVFNSSCWGGLYSCIPHCLYFLFSTHSSLYILPLSLQVQMQEFLPSYLASRCPINNTEEISKQTFSGSAHRTVLPDKLPMSCLALGDLSFCLMYCWLPAAFCSVMHRHVFIKGSPEP